MGFLACEFYLMEVGRRLCDIVARRFLPDYRSLKIVGTAETFEEARELAKESDFRVRQALRILSNVSEKDARELIADAKESGGNEWEAIESLIPFMTKEAKRRYLS